MKATDRETIAATSDGRGLRTEPSLERGEQLGRYVVLAKIGSGGMGVVYAAYDPDLDRKVAVKLLHGGAHEDAKATEGRKRLVREAQALAKLDHPNVVSVHDVGVHDDHVYVAMEFVQGVTLRDWLTRGRHGWQATLEVFSAAGEGLAAAHERGLIHRDFKPDNVMIGDDRRVRVMDFGLARATASEPDAEDNLEVGVGSNAVLESLTRVGGIVGTPAYMAPEQHLGLQVTPAADQFAFCVSLWEALYGERPFAGETLAALAASVTEGKQREPARRGVPRWLRRAIARGLSTDSAARHPSMRHLLDELGRGRVRARRRVVLLCAVSVTITSLAIVGYRGFREAQTVAACEARGEQIAEVWNDGRASTIAGRLEATGVPYAKTTVGKVMPRLEDYADAWQGGQTKACLDAEVEGTLSPQRHDDVMWCLEERRLELNSLLDEFERADAAIVGKSVAAVAALAPPSVCLADSLPSAPRTVDRELAVEVIAGLARTRALLAANDHEAAVEVADHTIGLADALGWAPLMARSKWMRGTVASRAGEFEKADELCQAAYFTAAAAGDWGVAEGAASDLIVLAGIERGRPADGFAWAKHAEVALEHAGDPLQLRELARRRALGRLYFTVADLERARTEFERGLAITRDVLGEAHPAMTAPLTDVANIHVMTADYGQAKLLYRRVIEIKESVLGPDHPDLAISLENLATVHGDLGEYEEALACAERALAILEAALGTEHIDVATSLESVGNVHFSMGNHAEAKRLLLRSLALSEKAYGHDHPAVAATIVNIANAEQSSGDVRGAKAMYERALAIFEHTYGPDHPTVALVTGNLATAVYVLGDLAAARALYERSFAIDEKRLGPDHPEIALTLHNLGRLARAEGRHDDAIALLERALKIWDGHEGVDGHESGAELELVLSLWEKGAKTRAIEVARRAQRRTATEGAREEDVVAVRAFLAEHDQP